jgi:hypothetical protein
MLIRILRHQQRDQIRIQKRSGAEPQRHRRI